MKFIIILGICLSLCSCTNEYREFRTTQTKVQETTSVQSLNDAGFSQSGVSISEVDLIVGPSSQILKNILSMTRSSTKTLRVNLYLLSHQEIITALIQAQKRGVDVRVILEKTVYQFAKINKESFEKLQKWGVSVAWASERDFNFNHAKYFISDDQWMLSTGNATKSSYSKNREFFVFGQDAQVHQDLVSIFDADFHQKSLSTPVQKITFSPINARSRIIRSLKEAKREIIIFSASVSDPEILELLKKRKEEGIAILLCVGDLPKASEISRFADLLGPEITYIQAKKPYVHAKSILIDQTYLLVGSMNLTANSLDHNREVGLILQNNSIVKPLRELITTQCGAP